MASREVAATIKTTKRVSRRLACIERVELEHIQEHQITRRDK
jgi:hypothetical protein